MTDDCQRSGPSVDTPSVSSPEEDDKGATAAYENSPLALNAACQRQPVRQRTAQACDKCRERKTKCSGHRPVCNRCTNRGLNCEYSAREMRTTTRPIPLRKDLTEIPAPQPAKYSGVCRSAQNIRGSARAGGALRTPSSSYGTPPPPYTPRRGHSAYDVRWPPSQQKQALSAQNGGSHMALGNGLPVAPMMARRRSTGASISSPSCRPAYPIPYHLPPHQFSPVNRGHEQDLAYITDGVPSMPMTMPESTRLPFDLEIPPVSGASPEFQLPSPSLFHDFHRDASPYGTERSPSQGHRHPCFLDDATSYFNPSHTLHTGDDHWSPVCSNIIPPPPPPMRYPEYTSEDLGSSPANLYGNNLHSPVSVLSSPNQSGASSQVELMCPAPIIPIGIGSYNHGEDGLFGSLGAPLEEPVEAGRIPDFGDRFNYSLTFFK
ncbi:hypothetical protein M413DRAFT_21596 [Hebeloma cylindrosporum]|uniref:Zn(2)-C6 fungal-type domain-containing protein n=1 Tax=Hebeloma cylindrosporum TaxID=76867 RepID=A0A0C3CZQ3_HEBCY|nr:hypothetical protein M413DRAFT_21596 [Hebeloma cylindrosporum h7]